MGKIKKLWPYLVLILITSIFYHKILLHPDMTIFPGGDIVGIFYQEKFLFKDTIWNLHQIPFWNPWVFSGTPYVGSGSSAIFYPLTWLFLFFPIMQTFGFLYMLDVFLIGLFTYLFARRIGLKKIFALCSGTAFMLSSPITSRTLPGHLYLIDSIVWFSALLWTQESFLQSQEKKWIVFSGICIGLMFLAGGSQMLLYGLVGWVLFTGSRKLFDNSLKIPYSRLLFSSFLVLSIGIAIGAAQILPTQEFASRSIRGLGVSVDWAYMFSLHPLQLITSIFPYILGSWNATFWWRASFIEDSLYTSVIVLPFLLFPWIKKYRKYSLSIAVMGTFALVYSFGNYTPIWYFFYYHIPTFNYFRTPSRFLYVYTFAIAVLAGLGGQNVYERMQKNKNTVAICLGLFLVFCGLFCGAAFIYFVYGSNTQKVFETFILNHDKFALNIDHVYLQYLFQKDLKNVATIFMSFGGFLLLTLKFKNLKKLFGYILLAFIFIDLWVYGSEFVQVTKPIEQTVPNSIFNTISKDKSLFRVFDLSTKLFYMTTTKLQNVLGMHSMQLKQHRNFVWQMGPRQNWWPYESFFLFEQKITNPDILSELNVKYIVSDVTLPQKQFKLLRTNNERVTPYYERFEKFYLYENTKFVPRAYLLNEKNIVVDVYNYEPNQINLRVNSPKNDVLVLSENMFPGWKAYDNGKEVSIERYKIFRSIKVLQGNNDIRFIYDPISVKVGLIVTISTVIVLILCGILGKLF